MNLFKFLGVSMFFVMALFLVVVNFSSVSSRYECKGKILLGQSSNLKTLYIIVDEYRWWVGLWSNAFGVMQMEIPGEIVNYYSNVNEVGEQLHVYSSSNELVGNFSNLSKTLTLDTSIGFFDGKCEPLK